MRCKKCGNNKNIWKGCPTCAEKTNNSMRIPLIIGLVILALILLIMRISNIVNPNKIGDKHVKLYLKNTYNEKIDKITLVQSIKNPDTNLGCDGSSFGTIKGKGNTEYYLAYSEVNDLSFTVSYDTHKEEYSDSYKSSLDSRERNILLYEKIQNTFSDYVNEVGYYVKKNSDDETTSIIDSKQDLYNMLSKVVEGYPTAYTGTPYTSLHIFINMDCFEFCKKEYDNIKMINDYLAELKILNMTYCGINLAIYTKDNIMLEFDKIDAVRIYDNYEYGKAWGESIEEFINRSSY